MAHQITVDDPNRTIRANFSGSIGFDEFVSLITVVLKEPYASLPYGVLLDFRDATFGTIQIDEINGFIGLLKEGEREIDPYHLVVLISQELEFGLSRMFENLSSLELKVKILATYDEDEAIEFARNSPQPSE